jgi:hypothetical protein
LKATLLNFVRAAIVHGGFTEDDLRSSIKREHPLPNDYKEALEESRQVVLQYLQVIESLQKEAK